MRVSCIVSEIMVIYLLVKKSLFPTCRLFSPSEDGNTPSHTYFRNFAQEHDGKTRMVGYHVVK